MGSRILLLEDEPLIALMLGDWILELGHQVKGPCNDAQSAMKLMNAEPVDAALLDVQLEDGDCYGVAEVLSSRKVPFAFMTGGQSDSVDDRFSEASVLLKPFDFVKMQRELEKLLVVAGSTA